MIPQDMIGAQLITLFKNKASRQDCDNYQVISLLSLVGKFFQESHPEQTPGTGGQSVSQKSVWFQKKQINN